MRASLRQNLGFDDDEASSWTTYAAWGGVAVGGVLAVIVAASLSSDPAKDVASTAQPAPAPQVVVRSDPAVLAETRRLVEAVRSLSDERDRLVARLDQMERTLGDVTAAIPRDRNAGAGPAAVQTAPGSQLLSPLSVLPAVESAKSAAVPASAPASVPAAPPASATLDIARAAEPEPVKPLQLGEVARDLGKPVKPAPVAGVAVPQPRARAESPTDSVGTRTEFAVDIGGGASIDGVKSLWANIRNNNGQLLDGLKPLVAMRENRHGVMELRLVVGPLSNASSAARLCAALSTTGISCQPTQYDGQRMALY
jgi:hypothetical protein